MSRSQKQYHQKVIIVLISLIIPLSFQIFQTYQYVNYSDNDDQETLLYRLDLESAGFWKTDYIHIDNNWSKTKDSYDWCKGSGTKDNPYVLENITIESNHEYGIILENSLEFFEIRNCTISNSKNGVKILNISNGIIENCFIGNISGTDGSNGVGSGGNGQNGGACYGVFMSNICNLTISNNEFCNISGGNGGNGADGTTSSNPSGGNGGNGGDLYGIFCENLSNFTFKCNYFSLLNGGNGGSGGTGQDGDNLSGTPIGNGGYGGNGGKCEFMSIYNSTSIDFRGNQIGDFQSGNGGNGGNGGNAILLESYTYGDGGEGGRGGFGGHMIGINYSNSEYILNYNNTFPNLQSGDGGNGGDGGLGGTEGEGTPGEGSNGGDAGRGIGFSFFNCYGVNNTLNELNNYICGSGGNGGNGGSGGQSSPGGNGVNGSNGGNAGDGKNFYGFIFEETDEIYNEKNDLYLINTGNGGAGGDGGSLGLGDSYGEKNGDGGNAGNGGNIYAFYFNASNDIQNLNNSMEKLYGGDQGKIGESTGYPHIIGRPGEIGDSFGLYFDYSSNINNLKNDINQLFGGSRCSEGPYNGVDGGDAVGVFINNSEEILNQKNIISSFYGGWGGHLSLNSYNMVSEIHQPGEGGMAAAFYLISSENVINNKNEISFLTGGQGGGFSSINHNKNASAGGSAHAFLIDSVINVTHSENDIFNLTGGFGGANMGNGVISNNITSGKGGMASGFYSINATYQTFISNIIANISGGNPFFAYNGSSGGEGGIAYAVYSTNSKNASIIDNSISNLFGGNGGEGYFDYDYEIKSNSGDGGDSYSAFFLNCTEMEIKSNTITNIHGGDGGSASNVGSSGQETGDAGNGGISSIYMFKSCENITIYQNKANTIVGGDGGDIDQSDFGLAGNGSTVYGIILNKTFQINIIGNNISNLISGDYGKSYNGGTNGTMGDNPIGFLLDNANHTLAYKNFICVQNNSDSGYLNEWDNGIWGNYWESYEGTDSDGDGIGDTPYDVPGTAGSQDRYPITDITSPQISILKPSQESVCGKTAPEFQVVINEENINYSWYTLNDGPYLFFTENGSIDQDWWDNIDNGSVNIKFYANDTFGSVGSTEVEIFKDIIKPTIKINEPNSFDLYGVKSPEIDVSITEPNLNRTWYHLSNISKTTENRTFTGSIEQNIWDEIGNGTVKITIYANDTAGNINFTELFLRKDIILPSISINTPYNGLIIGDKAPKFEVIINERNLNTTWYSLDNGLTNITFTENGSIIQDQWDNILDGLITIRFFANDFASNVIMSDITVEKDIEVPIISPVKPNNNTIIKNAPQINASVLDKNLEYIWYTVEGFSNKYYLSNNVSEALNLTIWENLLQGWFTIRIYANDSADNNHSILIRLHKDTLGPIIKIHSDSVNLEFKKKSPSIEIEIIEPNLEQVWYTINQDQQKYECDAVTGMNYITISQSLWDKLDLGEHVLTFYANDSLGLISEKQIMLSKVENDIDTNSPGDPIFLMILIFLIIGSACAGGLMIYVYRKRNASVERINKKHLKHEKAENVEGTLQKIQKKRINNEKFVKLFEKFKLEELVRYLPNEFTILSKDLWEFIANHNWEEDDLDNFIGEMLYLTPSEREKALDNIRKKRNGNKMEEN